MTATLRDETHMISAAALRRGRLMVLAAILLFALCLRSAVTSLSPLLTQISHEIGFGSAVIGVFGMLPTAMFAIAGLVTPALTERFDWNARRWPRWWPPSSGWRRGPR